MDTAKREYQHFIPQFILRNFSRPYTPPATPATPNRRRGKKKTYRGEPVVNSLRLSDGFPLEEAPVRRVCGLYDMYADASKPLKDQKQLEKKFGKLEARVGSVYRRIISAHQFGQDMICLKRTEKDVLRKFIFLLTYRGEQFHRKFNVDDIQSYDGDDKAALHDYMRSRGFARPIDVWLHNLEAILDLEMDAMGEWQKAIQASIYLPDAVWFIEQMNTMHLAICTPANRDEEFVLTENSYNVWDGPTNFYPRLHYFAPISPRLILVLRSNLLPESDEDAHLDIKTWQDFARWREYELLRSSLRTSILEHLPVARPAPYYVKLPGGRAVPPNFWSRDPYELLDPNDQFHFSISRIPTHYTQIINCFLLTHAFHGSRIIFNRKDVLLNLMEWFLTEPCEVGEDVGWEHTAKQTEYIKGLAHFMLRQGREIKPRVVIWPTETGLEIEQLPFANTLEARVFENNKRCDFNLLYERLGKVLYFLVGWYAGC